MMQRPHRPLALVIFLPPTSLPHPIDNDIFVDFTNYSAFDDDPTPELVAG